MDRFAAMVILLGVIVSLLLIILALFSIAPIVCSCIVSLLYSLYLFMAYEEAGVHHAQEFENRFWTIFAVLLSTALVFAKDSPFAFGLWSPSLGFVAVSISGYLMHLWDRYLHRIAMSRQTNLRRASNTSGSLSRLRDLGIPVEAHLSKINECLQEIDQLLIPSTINNLINQRYVLSKEREVIKVFEECDARALNYLISHVKLGLLFYKIKDHRNFNGKHRTEMINLLAVERLSILTVISRVIVLHSLQLLKLRANPRAEYWVRNILLNTHQDDLSELKTLTDAKGDYFCMNKLIFDDIKSESIRQDILNHIRKEAAVQQTHWQMGTRRSKRQLVMQWRKVLSDVDDTLYCSGGMYPAGVDKRFARKAVYPGVLAFYRELDLGTQGPEEWPDDRVGNLVFLSARPHVYKDMSEKHNFAKFEKLRAPGDDGRIGMHTTPSLLAGDLTSGSQFMVTNDFEPLARKKFDNFRRYVSLYPEYQHVFVCDNGQGDVRAGEMMFDSFPYEFEALYVHVVKDVNLTYGFDPVRWRRKEFSPFFFRTYPEAALQAAKRNQIRITGLRRICADAVKDFHQIRQWTSEMTKAERRLEINQSIWTANAFLSSFGELPVDLIKAERRWQNGEKVRTPYGVARVRDFDPTFDMYEVELDWRPLDLQLLEHQEESQNATIRPKKSAPPITPRQSGTLATVVETEEQDEETSTLDSGRLQRIEAQEIGEPSFERRPPRRTQSSPATMRTPRTGKLDSVPAIVRSSAPGRIKTSQVPWFTVVAHLNGRSISKFSPPSLPKIETKQQRPSLFTFFSPASVSASPSDGVKNQPQFNIGDECQTPFGQAKVVEHRKRVGVVVLDMIGWNARAYLQQSIVKPVQKSLLGSLLRQFSSAEASQKPLDFPYAEGTKLATPFGPGSVRRPLPVPVKGRPERARQNRSTIGISLDNWTLANGLHPVLYCTEAAARKWIERKVEDRGSIITALGTAIVASSRTLLEPFRQQPPPKQPPAKIFQQYYKDAAAVSTAYGFGRVRRFRHTDGFYEVSLMQWILADGRHPTAYLRKDAISHRIAKGCQEGYPVLTSLGLSGKLASVEPTTGVHLVTIPSAGMVCYLQPDSVVRPLKAAVGEDVLTPYGEGTVEAYDARNDIYVIGLAWHAKLYAKGQTFDRLSDGIQDRDGPFGVNWLLRFLFFSSESSSARTPSRSRSNSLVSGSHSNRSVN